MYVPSESLLRVVAVVVDIDREELLDLAGRYTVEGNVTALLAYLDTGGETRDGPLPTWEEFRDLADEYGMPV